MMNTRGNPNLIRNLLRKFGVLFSLAAVLGMGIQSQAMADMVSTEQVYTASQIDAKRQELRAFMAQDKLAAALEQQGVSQENIDTRLASMTDSEILEFHAGMEELPAGEGLLGIAIGLIVIFMLLDIAGVTDVFPSV